VVYPAVRDDQVSSAGGGSLGTLMTVRVVRGELLVVGFVAKAAERAVGLGRSVAAAQLGFLAPCAAMAARAVLTSVTGLWWARSTRTRCQSWKPCQVLASMSTSCAARRLALAPVPSISVCTAASMSFALAIRLANAGRV
jgi:hypothetical protein